MEGLFEVPDDSGFLGLFDPDAYVSFVDEHWSLYQLVAHSKEQMRHRRLLLWGTGGEGWWRVQVRKGFSGSAGFREVTGPIVASAGRLCLTHYESLTMGAQFRDVALPEPHEADLLLEVPPGHYNCRVLQLIDPDAVITDQDVDFVLEIQESSTMAPPWTGIPWSQL